MRDLSLVLGSNMKYTDLLVQKGEGCDYTIGCAKNWIEFTAPSHKVAIGFLKRHIDETYQGDWELKSARLFAVGTEIEIPLSEWYEC